MVFKKLRELSSKKLIYIGVALALIGYIGFNLFEKTGLVNVVLSILSCFVSLLGGVFLIWSSMKLKREKEQFGKTRAEERIEEKEKGREKNYITITIMGVIIVLIGLGINQYINWNKNQVLLSECKQDCCSYVESNKVWIDKCDISQTCTVIFGEISKNCRQFSTQDLCINYCFTDLKKLIEPKIPSWLKFLRNFY